jgi:hypothetical protein
MISLQIVTVERSSDALSERNEPGEVGSEVYLSSDLCGD